MNSGLFSFGKGADAKAVATATVPASAASKGALLDALSVGLSFPDYFGRNWDALEECLRDLAWLPAGRVVIVHEKLPPLDSSSLKTYLSILKGAVEKWRPSDERELVVVFPAADEKTVAAVVDG